MNRLKTSAIMLVVLGTGMLAAQTGLSRLGASETGAREIVMSAIRGNFSVGNAASSFLALLPGARAAAVNELVAWAKAHVKSPAFKQAWTTERDQAKPAMDPRGTVEDELKAKNAEQQKNIEDVRKMLPIMDASTRATMLEQIKQMEAMAKDPAQQTLLRQLIVAERTDKEEEFQREMKQWQEEYPADPNVIIATRLRDFLTVSADVDFDAKLATRGKLRIFADEQYEQKPASWKTCYRAGREATQAARAAAAAWLKELGR